MVTFQIGNQYTAAALLRDISIDVSTFQEPTFIKATCIGACLFAQSVPPPHFTRPPIGLDELELAAYPTIAFYGSKECEFIARRCGDTTSVDIEALAENGRLSLFVFQQQWSRWIYCGFARCYSITRHQNGSRCLAFRLETRLPFDAWVTLGGYGKWLLASYQTEFVLQDVAQIDAIHRSLNHGASYEIRSYDGSCAVVVGTSAQRSAVYLSRESLEYFSCPRTRLDDSLSFDPPFEEFLTYPGFTGTELVVPAWSIVTLSDAFHCVIDYFASGMPGPTLKCVNPLASTAD